MKRLKTYILLLVASLTLSAPFWSGYAKFASEAAGAPPNGYELPFGRNPFAPSNASTTSSNFISADEFIPASRCASCHRATHAEWGESAHRNSFREPFYQANVKHLIKDKGIAVTRHCESCHNPVALFSGALTSQRAKAARPYDDEGVTCSVCHSIQSVTKEGIGSYAIAPPAMLEDADGTRRRDAPDAEIRADLVAHRRAVMPALLRKPEFCAACHKSAIVPELNGRKWFRTFSVFDEWQQSAFAQEAIQPLAKRDYRSCQSCHMPKEAATKYASHRWPGGNTAIPAHYGWPRQLQATKEFLQDNAVTVDIFAVSAPDGPQAQTFTAPNAPVIPPGQAVAVDVVVANRGVGHAFPAELRDMFEAWLEFEARDATGRVLYHSGAARVVAMSEATVTAQLGASAKDNRAVLSDPSPELYRRWRAYGVALFDQQQYEAAAQAFSQARLFAKPATPEEAAVCVDLALAYLRLERAGQSQTILAQADECLNRALEITPDAARPLYYRALLHIKQFKYTAALAALESLARSQPQDR